MPSVAVLGAGAAGLITAHTLSVDGFDVQVITRDSTPGGQWASERIYPGLQLNNVHGEFRFSAQEMSKPPDSSTTGARLTGRDMRKYMQEFADKLLQGKILFDTEILNIRREEEGPSPWIISVQNRSTGTSQILRFSKVVLCTGGTSKPMIPDYLSLNTAQKVDFRGPVIHSAHFGARFDEILAKIPPKSAALPGSIVVVGGGKSAQDISAALASENRNVTIIYEKTDPSTAGERPLPDFLRKSRMLSILSPHIQLRTWQERFLHTTWLGNKVVHGNWDGIMKGSFKALKVPEDSPLRLAYSPFWNVHTNDEGVPRENGFYALVNGGKIDVIAPARMTGYADGDTILLNNGQSVKADLVILATGYTSSWGDIFDEKTAIAVGLHRHQLIHSEPSTEWENYRTLSNPPPLHSENTKWSSSLYKGIAPAKNLLRRDFAVNGAVLATNDGYTFEVISHWISSYFLGDKMKLPKTPEDALKDTERDALWLRKRYPDLNLSLNEACTSTCVFWTWPQYSDELLEDMYLRSMRSGGNWLTWPFKVISINELSTLHEEREANRRKNM
ncbi:FAD/NAD-P-binding domain-containing protein [Mycena vitilis]|nr:FAD/NAD-P-binding domain-containing protein [Mycena vitilis]KAJ6498100.1 FAD/NAD-P-binding domain-containing protein [Mycena vitilis]